MYFKRKLKTTFNFLQKPQAKNWKRSIVDMIFVGKSIKINQAFCPTINASDHLPLVLDFDFPLDC
jgi:endonuclease/exonuclease/phosphatase family metal-dependent hydrolase